MTQITTLTFFRFATFADRFWAFQMMQFAHGDLKNVSGQTFYRLMGSGKGLGFNPLPDWSVYALLQVWRNESDADAFFANSKLFGRYRAHTSELWTVYMKNIAAKGLWNGRNPFESTTESGADGERLAVITRASIRLSKLRSFWSYVPRSQEPLTDARGLLFTKGIGEWPVTQMATFSLWENAEAMKEFAYKSPQHREAIKRTRELDWYREEMFSRFRVYRSEGTWNGGDPLPPERLLGSQ
jgi:heme-degrading monooxygenase HmoA